MTTEHEGDPGPDATPANKGASVSRRTFLKTVGVAATGALATGTGVAMAGSETAPALKTSKNVLVQAMGLDIDLLDPHYFKSIPGYYAVCNLYDIMVDYKLHRQSDGGLYPTSDAHGNWIFQPWLAKTWQVSKDQKTLTFHLRNGLTFSDGRPLTAHDVKATWDRAITGQGYANLVTGMMTIDHPSQVVAKDAHTIVVHLTKPNPFALKLLAVNVMGIINSHALQAHATKSDPTAHKWLDTHAAGSGPYVLADWTPGVQWQLKPNPHYWNRGALRNSGTIIRTIPNASERYNLLVRGDIDVAYDLLPKDLAALRNNPNIRLIQFKVPWPYYLGMNNTIAPFNDPKVRQAISYAIPQKTIIDKVLHGFGRECRSPVAAGMPTSYFGASPYTYDPAKAKALLQKAGASNLKFDLAILQGRPEDQQTAVWIQASLAQAGVQMNIAQMTDAAYYGKFGKHELQAWIGEFYSWVNDPFYHLFWNFSSTASATNATGYHNKKADSLITQGMYETNTAKRVKLSREAQKLIMHDAPWALLYQINYTIAVRKNVHNFNWYPDVGTRFEKVYKS